MSETEETLKNNEILKAIADLSSKFDTEIGEIKNRLGSLEKDVTSFKKSTDVQLEAIRQGIVDNNIRFDRLEGNFHLLRAEVTTLIEEVRHNRTVLV